MTALGFHIVAILIVLSTTPDGAQATDKPASQEKANAKRNTEDPIKSEALSRINKSRADVRSEAAQAKKSGAITEGGSGPERHRDPCTKQSEMSECRVTAPKK